MSGIQRLGFVVLMLLVVVFASGCSKDVTIGAIISESGFLESYGDKVKKGMELALDEVNAAGGINGGQISIIFKDDATNPQRGTQVARELIDEDGIRVIVGALSSPVTLAIAPICEEEEVLLFSPSASSSELSGAGEYIYRNYPSDILEGTSMARFAKDLGLEKMVVFALDNEFGLGLSQIFTQQYENRFREVIQTYTFAANDESQFDTWVAEVVESKPDGIYIAAYQDDTAVLLTKLREAGVESVLLSNSSVTTDLVRLAGDAAENLVYPQSVFDLESSDPAVADFVSAYRERYQEDPDTYAAHGYDAIKILAKGMSEQGAHPDDLRIALNGLVDYIGAAGKTMFDKNGDVIRHPRLLLIRNGNPMPYDRFVEEGGSILPGS